MSSQPNTVVPFYSTRGGATPLTRNEAQSFCRSILNSQKYRDNLRERMQTGKAAPNIEAMVWAYGYGKPIEQVQITHTIGQEDLSQLSVQELQRRAAQMYDALAEAAAIAEAIPADILGQP